MKIIITNNRLLIFSHGWSQFMMSTLYRNLLINISWSTVYIMYNTETTVDKYTLLFIKSPNQIYWLSNKIYWLSNPFFFYQIIHSNWLVLFIKSSNQITHFPQSPLKLILILLSILLPWEIFLFYSHCLYLFNLLFLFLDFFYSCLICVRPSSLSKITMTQMHHTIVTMVK